MAGLDETVEVIPGLTSWVNPRNGFTIVKLHYTADPAKRSAEWRESAKAGMPDRGWQREYELSFEAPLGQAVVPEFSAENIRPVKPNSGRILRGWDFGALSPAVVFAQLDVHGRKLVIGELILQQVTIDQLVDAVKAMTVELFGRPEPCFDVGDPEAESFKDMGQIRRILSKHQIMIQTSRSSDSYDNLRKAIIRRVVVPGEGVTAAELIHPRCSTLIEALQGAFHYPERPTQKEPKPVPSHPYKDVMDAYRYLNDNLTAATTDFVTQMKKVASADIVW